MAVSVIPITIEHVESFHRCLDGVARERKYLVFLEAPPIETTRAWIAACLEAGNPQFVAVDGNTVVGWCDVTRKPREAMNHSGSLGMGITAAYRHQGLGRKLLAATLEASKRAGLERVELTVYTTNLNAICLYESMGFEREGLARRFTKIDGVWFDAIEMAWFPG